MKSQPPNIHYKASPDGNKGISAQFARLKSNPPLTHQHMRNFTQPMSNRKLNYHSSSPSSGKSNRQSQFTSPPNHNYSHTMPVILLFFLFFFYFKKLRFPIWKVKLGQNSQPFCIFDFTYECLRYFKNFFTDKLQMF